MFSKIIIVLFAINIIPAVNGFIDSKLRVLDPILKCFKANAPEYAGEKALAAGRNLDSDADFIKWTCLAFGVSSQTKLMQDKLNKDINMRLNFAHSPIHQLIHPCFQMDGMLFPTKISMPAV